MIIVNDNSTDKTYEYLTELSKKHQNLKVINISNDEQKDDEFKNLKGKRYALRKGILASQNDYVVLTDADCKPNSNKWLSEITKAFENEKTEIILGYSPYFKENSLINLLIQIETFFTALQYIAYANIGKPYMGVGRNIAYKKSLLTDKIFKKSNKTISGDDDLIVQQLANKNNTAYIISNNSIVKSVPKRSFKSWIKQKKRHLSAGLYYSKNIKLTLNLFPIFHILFIIISIYLFLINSYEIVVLGSLFFVILFTYSVLNFKRLSKT